MFTNSKHFSCNLCDDKFPTAYHLDYHISSFHSKLILTGNPAALNGMDENTTPNKTTKVSAETVNPNKRKRTPAGSEKIECEQCASNIERVRNFDMLETEQSNLMQMYEECQSNSSNQKTLISTLQEEMQNLENLKATTEKELDNVKKEAKKAEKESLGKFKDFEAELKRYQVELKKQVE